MKFGTLFILYCRGTVKKDSLRAVRRNSDWKLWMRWMLDGLAEPRNSTPGVY